jgi:E3 ubiquitin-protein ligase UBR7
LKKPNLNNVMASEATAEVTQTLADVLEREHQQIEEAALSIPHQFSACTYHLGYIRQPVYLCKTCSVPRGLCAACSVACHHDHEQLELFPKREFRCDCPTQAYSHPCSLIPNNPRPINERNNYNQNFQGDGQFCRCGRYYDPHTETETMIQCLSCEV